MMSSQTHTKGMHIPEHCNVVWTARVQMKLKEEIQRLLASTPLSRSPAAWAASAGWMLSPASATRPVGLTSTKPPIGGAVFLKLANSLAGTDWDLIMLLPFLSNICRQVARQDKKQARVSAHDSGRQQLQTTLESSGTNSTGVVVSGMLPG